LFEHDFLPQSKPFIMPSFGTVEQQEKI